MNILWLGLLAALGVTAPDSGDKRSALPEVTKPEKIELRKEEVSLSMYWFVRKPVVEIKINGKGPFRFYLDTGAQGCVLDQALADELKLPVIGKARVGSPGGKGVPAKRVRLDRVEVGDAVLSTVPAVSFDRSGLGAAGKDMPRGVLSTAIFSGVLVTLDYPRSRMEIRRGELPAADGKRVFDYDGKRRLPRIRLSVAGQEVDVHLDSGSPGGIMLPLELAKRLPLAAKPVKVGRGKRVDQEVIIWGAKLKGVVKLGQYELMDPELRFQDIPGAPGHVGYGFLRRFAVTLDARNHRLQFEEKLVKDKGVPDEAQK
jgi:hypothetical protein